MINIYKAGGKHKKQNGTEYSVKTINNSDKPRYIIDGWVSSLSDVEDIEEAVFTDVTPARKAKAKRANKS